MEPRWTGSGFCRWAAALAWRRGPAGVAGATGSPLPQSSTRNRWRRPVAADVAARAAGPRPQPKRGVHRVGPAQGSSRSDPPVRCGAGALLSDRPRLVFLAAQVVRVHGLRESGGGGARGADRRGHTLRRHWSPLPARPDGCADLGVRAVACGSRLAVSPRSGSRQGGPWQVHMAPQCDTCARSGPVVDIRGADALMAVRRVGYVVNAFPKLSETFIAREVAQLLRCEIDVRILSLRTPAEP